MNDDVYDDTDSPFAPAPVAIDWGTMELLCEDAPWAADSKVVPPGARRRKASGAPAPRGRPSLSAPRRNRVAVMLTDAEYEQLQAYAAARQHTVAGAARLGLVECLERERCASRAADTASEGAIGDRPNRGVYPGDVDPEH